MSPAAVVSVAHLTVVYCRQDDPDPDYAAAVSTACDRIVNALAADGLREVDGAPGMIALAGAEHGGEYLGIVAESVNQTTTFLVQLATSFEWGALSLIS